MIVCDRGGEDRLAAQEGETREEAVPREIVSIPIALCDECITLVCKNLGHLKVSGKSRFLRVGGPTLVISPIYCYVGVYLGEFMGFENQTTEQLKDQLASTKQERDHANRHPGLGTAHDPNYAQNRERDVEKIQSEINRREEK